MSEPQNEGLLKSSCSFLTNVTNSKPQRLIYMWIYLIWYAYAAGSQHDLDLNLGISTSSSKEFDRLGSSRYHPYDIEASRKPKVLAE